MPQPHPGPSAVAAAVVEGGSTAQAALLDRLRSGDQVAFAELVDTWSPMLDVKILLKTVPAVLSGKGAR